MIKVIDKENLKKIRISRLKMILIASLFAVPMIGSWFLLQKVERGNLWGTTNKGNLVIPARPLEAFSLHLFNHTVYTLESMRGKWTLVYFTDSVCDEICKLNIYYMRQVWVALGKDMQRVQHLLVLEDESLLVQLNTFLKAYPQLSIGVGDKLQLQGLLKQFELDDPNNNARIFLVDPLGNLMMRYSSELDPKDMLKDLKKLLKASQIG